MHDYHVHSNYSDGDLLPIMLAAAEDAGLDGVGIADHCNVAPDPEKAEYKRVFGFNLDATYERRREAIDVLRERHDVRVFDAVEMDYQPDIETAIGDFLAAADFDYAIGSVHEIEGNNVHWSYFADLTDREQQTAVDRYFEKLVALVESELFEIAAHPDIVERNPALRGYATEDHYRRVAAALEESRTVPELNAGRIDREYGEFHPAPAFLSVLAEYDIEVTIGSDSHSPGELRERTPRIERRLAELDLPVTTLSV